MISDADLNRWEAAGHNTRADLFALVAEVRCLRAAHVLIAELDVFAVNVQATLDPTGYPMLLLNMNDIFVPGADAQNIALEDAPALLAILQAEGREGLIRWVAATRGCPIPAHYQRKAP